MKINRFLSIPAQTLWFSTEDSCSFCSGAAQNCAGPHTPLPQKMPSLPGDLSVLVHCESCAGILRTITNLGTTLGCHSLLESGRAGPGFAICLEKERRAALIHPEQTEALGGTELLLRNKLRMLCETPCLYSLGAAALNLQDFVRTF